MKISPHAAQSRTSSIIVKATEVRASVSDIDKQPYSQQKFEDVMKYCSEATTFRNVKACLTLLFAPLIVVCFHQIWPLDPI